MPRGKSRPARALDDPRQCAWGKGTPAQCQRFNPDAPPGVLWHCPWHELALLPPLERAARERLQPVGHRLLAAVLAGRMTAEEAEAELEEA